MKTTALITILTLLFSGFAFAEKDQKRERPDIDALIVQLKLDASKAEKFKAILKEQREAMQAKRKKNRENKQEMTREKRQEMRKQMEAQREAMDEKLLTVLSYEQLYKFKKYMKQFRRQPGMNKERMKQNKE